MRCVTSCWLVSDKRQRVHLIATLLHFVIKIYILFHPCAFRDLGTRVWWSITRCQVNNCKVLRCLGAFIPTTTFMREITPLLQIRQFAHLRSTTCSLQGLCSTQRSARATPSRDLTLGVMHLPWLELECTNPGSPRGQPGARELEN